MKSSSVTGFLCLMLFDTLAQVSFKLAGQSASPFVAELAWLGRLAANPWIYGALGGYLGAFYTWMTLLKHAPIGSGFAATHLQIISVLLVSVWLFGEQITAIKLAGSVLILIGIAILGLAETRRLASS
jgi:drug/metabolite transporter (DMT)-like permease